MSTKLREDALSILQAGISRVDPYRMITNSVSKKGRTISIRTETDTIDIDLSEYERIVVVGAGKATARMARGIEDILGGDLDRGVIAVKPGHVDELKRVRMIEAGHPVPNQGSLDAARAIISIASEAEEKTLVFNLVSGGGSALLTSPYRDDEISLSLTDMQETTSALLACGATIQEINCVRKHLSAIKGGRLAAALAPARVVSLILSDVVGDDLSSIASGLTAPDPTTFADVARIFKKYGIEGDVPTIVVELVQRGIAGAAPDTPGPKDPSFDRVSNVLLGSNAQALGASARKATELGYNTIVLGSQITGEAREIGHFYGGILRDLRRFGRDPEGATPTQRPACILAGGETTVTIRGEGKGGRNQEMAASVLSDFVGAPETIEDALFLSGATDGNDGPTDAAGGLVDREAVQRAIDTGEEIDAVLGANDSYHLLKRIDALVTTGPTNTNVCDIQIVLVR